MHCLIWMKHLNTIRQIIDLYVSTPHDHRHVPADTSLSILKFRYACVFNGLTMGAI